MSDGKEKESVNRELIEQMLEEIVAKDINFKSQGRKGINPDIVKDAKELLKKLQEKR